MSAHAALRGHADVLSNYEKAEILGYDIVYYLGNKTRKTYNGKFDNE
jgi:hypothetical protein